MSKGNGNPKVCALFLTADEDFHVWLCVKYTIEYRAGVDEVDVDEVDVDEDEDEEDEEDEEDGADVDDAGFVVVVVVKV